MISTPPACRAPGLDACSACSGDYEDPERTPGNDQGGEDAEADRVGEGEAEPSARDHRFPVREE